MKKNLFFIFLLTIVLIPLSAEQLITLPGLNRPSIIEADGKHLYIVDDPSVMIYSLKNFKLVKKFGRKGEGPREFRLITSLCVSNDDLLVNSRNKVSFFSKDGLFLKEIKVARGADFIRAGNQFVGMDMEIVDKISHITINLYDSKLKKIKNISHHKGLFLGSKDLDPILIYGPLGPEYRIINNNILTKSSQEALKIIEPGGKVLSTISLAKNKLELKAGDKEEILDFYRTNPRTKRNFPSLKKKFKFPGYFPAIRNYHVDGSHIFILTFKETKEGKEILVYDLKGRFAKQMFLPVSEANILELFPYTIKKNTLYQLEEGEEEWKLMIKHIK